MTSFGKLSRYPGCLATKKENFNIFFLLTSISIIKMAGRGPGRAPGEYINLPSRAAADVDAYFEYRAYEKK